MKRNIDMPPYTVARKRKNHTVYYFAVPARLRPPEWPETIRLGTDTEDGLKAIHDRAQAKYKELLNLRRKADLHIQDRITPGTMLDINDKYHRSDDYRLLAKATQKSYDERISVIQRWAKTAGNPHIQAYSTQLLYAFLAKFSDKPRTKQYTKAVLSVLYNVGIRHGYVERNLVKEIRLPRRKKKVQKRLVVWEQADVDRFVAKADDLGYWNVGTAVMIAFYTGQRQADIFRYSEPHDYKDGKFQTHASKTGQIVRLKADPRLVERLKQRPDTQLLLTVNDSTGRQWGNNTFNKKFRRVCDALGMDGYVFRQLRNSAAMHAVNADLTAQEFEAVFGWPVEAVNKMLRDYYSDRNQESADKGIAKLSDYRARKGSRTNG